MSQKCTKEEYDNIIRAGGFYDDNGVWNSIKVFSNDNHIYRERVETIVVKNKDKVFVKRKVNGDYYLPGGSTEPDVSHIQQAINECNEEARIEVRNIQSTGITYKKDVVSFIHDDNVSPYVEWDRTINEIYVAQYDGKYTGAIEDCDKDPFILSGSWVPVKECLSFFIPEHRDALMNYLRQLHEEDEVMSESYIGNYFKNKILLAHLNCKPEFGRKTMTKIIDDIDKAQKSVVKTSYYKKAVKEKSLKDKIFGMLVFTFNGSKKNKYDICIAYSGDATSFTPAAATHIPEYGDTVIVYPGFFKLEKNEKIFVLLHEIGHIRLNHTVDRNQYWLGLGIIPADTRSYNMKNNRVSYEELNADLYAVLNGADMYSILGLHEPLDYDNQYDYRYSNAELANRYRYVFGKTMHYNNGRLPYSKERLKELEKEGRIKKESALSDYEIAGLALHELVYENSQLDTQTNKDKDILYNILFEFVIDRQMKCNDSLSYAKTLFESALKDYRMNRFDYISYMTENGKDVKDDDDDRIARIKNAYNNINNIRNRDYYFYCESLNNHDSLGKDKSITELSEKKEAMKYFIMNEAYTLYDVLDDQKALTYNLQNLKMIVESLTQKERNKIPEELFGIPELRKYPLDSKKHVRSAIKLYYKYEKTEYAEELATNILKAMKHYKMKYDNYVSKGSSLDRAVEKYHLR